MHLYIHVLVNVFFHGGYPFWHAVRYSLICRARLVVAGLGKGLRHGFPGTPVLEEQRTMGDNFAIGSQQSGKVGGDASAGAGAGASSSANTGAGGSGGGSGSGKGTLGSGIGVGVGTGIGVAVGGASGAMGGLAVGGEAEGGDASDNSYIGSITINA
jgi:hypothetical protein